MSAAAAAGIAEGLRKAGREMYGIVVSAGKMDKTVKVRLGGQRWEQRVHKWFKQPRYKLVHDPRNSLRQGDAVSITPSWRESQHVRHVVKAILAPHGGLAIEDRPPIPTMAERAAERMRAFEHRQVRRHARRAADALPRVLDVAGRALRRITAGRDPRLELRELARLGGVLWAAADRFGGVMRSRDGSGEFAALRKKIVEGGAEGEGREVPMGAAATESGDPVNELEAAIESGR